MTCFVLSRCAYCVAPPNRRTHRRQRTGTMQYITYKTRRKKAHVLEVQQLTTRGEVNFVIVLRKISPCKTNSAPDSARLERTLHCWEVKYHGSLIITPQKKVVLESREVVDRQYCCNKSQSPKHKQYYWHHICSKLSSFEKKKTIISSLPISILLKWSTKKLIGVKVTQHAVRRLSLFQHWDISFWITVKKPLAACSARRGERAKRCELSHSY